MPSVIYGKVDAEVAGEIVKKHLIGRELLDGHILDRPSADIVNTK
jgi:NADP-reducing hydrogenase subunit HndB